MTFHTNFKHPRSSKVDRFYKRMDLKREEDRQKAEVRKRDKRCRFPLCGCGKMKIQAHVSHQRHKGMGGNPAGERSDPALMIYVCACRHRENAVSIDRGTLRWTPLSASGANGPVVWDVDASVIGYPTDGLRESRWLQVAVERSPGVWEPFTPTQAVVLARLAEMRL